MTWLAVYQYISNTSSRRKVLTCWALVLIQAAWCGGGPGTIQRLRWPGALGVMNTLRAMKALFGEPRQSCWPFDRIIISCLSQRLAWTPTLLFPSRLSHKHPVAPQTGHRLSHITDVLRLALCARVHCASYSLFPPRFVLLRTRIQRTDDPQQVSFHLL